MPKRKRKRVTYNRVSSLKIPTPPKPIKSTRKQAVYELDTVYSWRLRVLHADKDGNCKCITCPVVLPWLRIQNGHMISRRIYKRRRNVRNTRPQCKTCNLFKNGNYWVYYDVMRKRDPELADIYFEGNYAGKRELANYTTASLQDQIRLYEKKLLQEAKKKSIDIRHCTG